MSIIGENVAAIKCLIPPHVVIVAATKSVGAASINELYSNGIIDYGENRVQDYLSKSGEIDKNMQFHFIGRLQTNKVRYIIETVSMIQSLDRLRLAEEIDKRAKSAGRVVPCLVEINSGEEQKGGINPDEAEDFIRLVARDYAGINIRGIMSVLPQFAGFDKYLQVADLYGKLKKENIAGADMQYLSMGMSDDFEMAIAAGANMIRPGRIIFSKR